MQRDRPIEGTFLIGEPETESYASLQERIGRSLYGQGWVIREIPKSVAAWLPKNNVPPGWDYRPSGHQSVLHYHSAGTARDLVYALPDCCRRNADRGDCVSRIVESVYPNCGGIKLSIRKRSPAGSNFPDYASVVEYQLEGTDMDKKWVLPALLVFGTGTAWAQQTIDESSLYLGVGVGWSDVDEPGLDESDAGYKIFLGYRAREWLDAEVAYMNLGDFGSLEPDGFQLSGLARFAVGSSIDIFGKAGLYAWNSSDSVFDFDDTGVDPVLGFGGRYRLDGKFGVRAEYERFYNVDNADVDLFSVSATYDF